VFRTALEDSDVSDDRKLLFFLSRGVMPFPIWDLQCADRMLALWYSCFLSPRVARIGPIVRASNNIIFPSELAYLL
jgi:hypothetical protein